MLLKGFEITLGVLVLRFGFIGIILYNLMRLTISYIFKFKAQTKRELLKVRARIHKWFYFTLGQKIHMDLSMVRDNSLRKSTRKISILKSPFIHKKA
jgi:hypothetical protein